MIKEIRLQKILADTGKYSRREADELIQLGEVTVNGKVATPGTKANPSKDHIKVSGKLLKKPELKVVLALFKPRGVMSYNPVNRKEISGTVFQLLPKVKERVQPVGRLETEHEGLLLLTNDGELAQRLMRAKYGVTREYQVKIDGHLEEKKIKRMSHGVEIEGKNTHPLDIEVGPETEGKQWYVVRTIDPRHRIIKKIFEFFGHPVDKVKRTAFGPIKLTGLQRGQYRELTHREVEKLYQAVGLGEKK